MAYQSWSVVFGEQPSAAKWNILGTNDASFNDGTGIGASAITPEKLLTGTGTSWGWSTWSPTWTGLTAGNSTITTKYKQTGKSVTCAISVVIGSSGSTSIGNITGTLPVTASSLYTGTNLQTMIGMGRWHDVGTAIYNGVVYISNSTTIFTMGNQLVNASYSSDSVIPFAGNSGDTFGTTFIYEAA